MVRAAFAFAIREPAWTIAAAMSGRMSTCLLAHLSSSGRSHPIAAPCRAGQSALPVCAGRISCRPAMIKIRGAPSQFHSLRTPHHVMDQVDKAYRTCTERVRKSGSSFYYGMRFCRLPSGPPYTRSMHGVACVMTQLMTMLVRKHMRVLVKPKTSTRRPAVMVGKRRRIRCP